MVQGLGLWAGLGILSRARCSVLGRGLVACWGTGGLRLMNCTRVVREGLWSVDALLRSLRSLSLCRELGASWGPQGLWVGTPTLTYHPGSTLQHGIHRLSRVGCHGLDDLLLAVLLWVVLKVGLRVGGCYQRGPSC